MLVVDVSSAHQAVVNAVPGARASVSFPRGLVVAKLIISVGIAGVKTIAGPIIGAAVLFAYDVKMPRFQAHDPVSGVTNIYSLLEPRRIPSTLLPHVVEHIKKIALACAVVHRPAVRVISQEDTPWAVMGRAAARTAERAVHLRQSDVQIGKQELEIYIPPGGSLPYEFVGKIGQRPVVNDWRRGAAHVLARMTHRTYMLALAEKYPEYGFDAHLGKDSDDHRRAVRRHGATPEHRGQNT